MNIAPGLPVPRMGITSPVRGAVCALANGPQGGHSAWPDRTICSAEARRRPRTCGLCTVAIKSWARRPFIAGHTSRTARRGCWSSTGRSWRRSS